MRPFKAWLLAPTFALAALIAAASPAAAGCVPGAYVTNTSGVTANGLLDATCDKGYIAVVGTSITTPSGTTAYSAPSGTTAGDLIANSATAGSVTPLQFAVGRINGGTGFVRRVRISTTDSAFLGATVRLHLHKTAPTYSNGDNGTWLTTDSAEFCKLDVTFDETHSDDIKGTGVPVIGSECFFDTATGSQVVYGELEARSAVTPTGIKAFSPVLEVSQN